MAKVVERWVCEKCGQVYENREDAERCEQHHYSIQDTEFIFTQWGHFPKKVILTVFDSESGLKWKVPAELVIDEEGEDWVRLK